jgi:ribosomal protein S19
VYKIYKYNKVFIHKGLGFKKLKINNFIIFKKFGFFILTKKPFKFPEKKKKKKR